MHFFLLMFKLQIIIFPFNLQKLIPLLMLLLIMNFYIVNYLFDKFSYIFYSAKISHCNFRLILREIERNYKLINIKCWGKVWILLVLTNQSRLINCDYVVIIKPVLFIAQYPLLSWLFDILVIFFKIMHFFHFTL